MGMWGLVRGQYAEVGGDQGGPGQGLGVRKSSLRAMASALGRRASDMSMKSFGCVRACVGDC